MSQILIHSLVIIQKFVQNVLSISPKSFSTILLVTTRLLENAAVADFQKLHEEGPPAQHTDMHPNSS
jgi:hypothetical protein